MKNSRLVLIGFGKDLLLKDLISLIGTDRESFLLEAACIKNKPPVYKSETAASDEEKQTFIKYGKWLEQAIQKIDEGKF